MAKIKDLYLCRGNKLEDTQTLTHCLKLITLEAYVATTAECVA